MAPDENYLHLKCVRQGTLSPAAKLLFDDVFGWFSREPLRASNTPTQKFKRAIVDSGIQLGEQIDHIYRRFSGGTELPHGAYYTLCEDEGGNDRGALIRELMAYLGIHNIRDVFILDSNDTYADPVVVDDALSHLRRVPPKTIRVLLCIGPDTPSNHIELFHRIGNEEGSTISYLDGRLFEMRYPMRLNWFWQRIEADVGDEIKRRFTTCTEIISVDVKYQVRRISRNRNILDLREVGSLELIRRILFEGMRYTLFAYKNAISPRLLVQNDPFLRLSHEEQLREARSISLGEVARGFPAQREEIGDPPSDRSLQSTLPYLLCALQGGSAITEEIGRHVRCSGYTGLVFPAARTSCHVMYENDEVRDWDGFCFVDYSGAPSPDQSLTIVVEPESWPKLYKNETLSIEYTDDKSHIESWVLMGREEIEFLQSTYRTPEGAVYVSTL